MPDEQRMTELTRGERSVSDKIRALDSGGFSRSDIAKFLGKRYQHVRNVLVQDETSRKKRTAPAAESGSNGELPERLDIRVGPGGRIVIPAVFRAAMGVKEGDRLMASVVDGELRLITPMMAVQRAQKLVRETIPGDDSLVDELIAERRREAEREMADD